MTSPAPVLIHPSQFPNQVERELVESLRRHQLNHKFLYDGWKQTQNWLALHEACSPARNDPDCVAVYARAFEAAASRLPPGSVHLVGLGCGGGQKDTQGLRGLLKTGKSVSYTPVDVSTAMVVTAREVALAAIPELKCTPLVCDLGTATDLPATFAALAPCPSPRLITFFGMMPNFEPGTILPRLASLLRAGDLLLVSANLAPGADYAQGMRQILPLYNNPPTRNWLWGFLADLGLAHADGEFDFTIEVGQRDLKRVTARFRFDRARQIQVGADQIPFRVGDSLCVFFSYRHTPALMRDLLLPHQLEISEQWITTSGEEGVFLVEKVADDQGR